MQNMNNTIKTFAINTNMPSNSQDDASLTNLLPSVNRIKEMTVSNDLHIQMEDGKLWTVALSSSTAPAYSAAEDRLAGSNLREPMFKPNKKYRVKLKVRNIIKGTFKF